MTEVPNDYFDDNPGRRSISGMMTSEEAVQAAKELAQKFCGKI